MNINKTLISLLRFAVCGGEFDKNLINGLDDEALKQLYVLAKKHDMAHIVSKALSDLGVSLGGEISGKFIESQMMAIYRYEQGKHELSSICNTFEKNKIEYIPLKGSVIREYYAEPWMRTSCDIDILVHKSDLKRSVNCLEEDLRYVYSKSNVHDVSLFSPTGLHLELHHRLSDESSGDVFEQTLDKVFDYTQRVDGFEYKLNMTSDMFYYFHIVHMAKHFILGGCGIKPLLDLWVLEHRADYKLEDAKELLEKGGLLKFAECIRKLAEVWFSGEEYDEVSKQLEEYIVIGGVYGNLQNTIMLSRTKRKGRIGFIFSKIFLSKRNIKMAYPILEKCIWLLPFCHVHRWVKYIFKGGTKRSANEMKINNSITNKQIDDAEQLLKNIGL